MRPKKSFCPSLSNALLAFAIGLHSQVAQSAVELSAGILGQNLGKEVAAEETGEGGWVGTTLPYFTVQWSDPSFFGTSGLKAGLGSSIFGTLDQEGTSLQSVYRYSGKWILPLESSGAFLGVGPSLEVLSIRGSGGSTVLENGNATSTFPLPGRSVLSAIWCVDMQGGWQVPNSGLGLLGEVWLKGLLGEGLSFSALFSLSYTFGGGG
jgi:hypothetical protein